MTFLSGIYEPVSDERDDTDLRVTGAIPAALRGSFLRNGPNPQFPPRGRYHVFDGDGMIHGIDLADGRARYRNRYIVSSGLQVERELGRAVYGGLAEFTMPEPEIAERGGIVKNTANTNIIRHGGRLLALMEAGPPTELSSDLETLGTIDFDGALAGPMTAHPRTDPATGDMHFFGYEPFPPYLRYHVANAAGALVRTEEIPIGRSVMMHDFVITENHVVFFDLPALFDVSAMLEGGAGFRFDADAGARIGLMPRSGTGADTRWYDIDPCYVFHFVNAWERDGAVVIDGCRAPQLPVAFGDDAPPSGDVEPRLHRWTVDPAAGTVSTQRLDDRAADFPRINDDYTGRRNRWSYLGHTRSWDGDEAVFDGVTVRDNDADTDVSFTYGSTSVSGEAVFAADPDGTEENDGWLLNFVTDLADNSSRFSILDARDVEAGPVADIHLPRRVPFGFHGNWMADA